MLLPAGLLKGVSFSMALLSLMGACLAGLGPALVNVPGPPLTELTGGAPDRLAPWPAPSRLGWVPPAVALPVVEMVRWGGALREPDSRPTSSTPKLSNQVSSEVAMAVRLVTMRYLRCAAVVAVGWLVRQYSGGGTLHSILCFQIPAARRRC